MTNFNRLLEFHERARAEGASYQRKREAYTVVAGDSGRHFIGVVGPRGAGKTVLLKQLAAAGKHTCYLSADTLPPDADLFGILSHLAEAYKFHTFLLDEIHFLNDAAAGLKQAFDFLKIRVIFTSSVAVAMEATAHDLSRRVRLHRLDYFSLREYLLFAKKTSVEKLRIDEILSGRISAEHLRAAVHFDSYLRGGMLPFGLEEPDPLPLLKGSLEKIIQRDIPRTLNLRADEIPLLAKVLAFIGRAEVDGINYSTLAANLKITKYKAEQYTAAFESAFVLQRLFPAGTNVMREPKVLLVPPIRLLHREESDSRGGLREDFFALAMRQAGIPVQYLKSTRGQKTPDFLIMHKGQKLVCEVGGSGKGRNQFKGVTADRKIIFSPEGTPGNDRMPLHLLGFLA